MTDFEPYLAGLRERREKARVARIQARDRALVLAGELARVLVGRYGAQKVVLVGSLARGDFGSGSDIDLAVEGLAAGALFAAGAELEALARDIRVDLVPLESATSAFRARTAEEGLVLR